MRLPPEETERFYRIWFALLHYINTQLQLVPAFPATPGVEEVSTEVTMQLRDALWANDALREQFITDNPAQLSAEDLALVASWQYRVAGAFFIYRSLQKYTIFLSSTTPAHAYGVLGLVSTIEETVPLPLAAHAANQRNDIRARNRKVFTAFRRELSKGGLSPHMVEVHTATIEDFAHTTLLDSDPQRGVLDLTFDDIQSYLDEKPGKQPLTSFKRFMRFLIGTGRIDYEQGEYMYDLLKHR